MKKFRFLEWKVYKDSKELFAYILGIVRKLPSDLRWSIGSQLTRASFSIVLNIAEGSGKESDKDMKRYFDIALGSCYELLASADTLKDGMVLSNEHFQEIYTRVDNVTSQLGGFKRSMK